MRKLTFLASLALTLAWPLQADDDRHQSHFTYDDGGTVVRTSEEDREIEARVNLPVFPGDQVITARRGRSEIRLADGNVIALDGSTAVRFRSVLDSYEGDASETVIELQYGRAILYRTDLGRDYLRLDTSSATYFASREAIFSVETGSGGEDRVSVFEGDIEVRTPVRTSRLRAGEEAKVDDRGLYQLTSTSYGDDFERWFVRRAQRYGRASSRYLDRSLAYYDDDLIRHGSWTYVSGYGWGWRPHVSLGWRPYYNGYWNRSRYGCLTWVSYEPWGWAPYHYGRWAHDPFYGWFWLPGTGYAPAWVYWWYGSGYLGWAPAGWWDCYRPYYNWAYRPFSHHGLRFGFGFHGRVRVSEVDLRPWTFIDSNTIVSTRVDRAALTTDAIKSRLLRDNGGFATISSDPARFTRREFNDPTATINRRSIEGGGSGKGGSVVDVTPFIRRDADLPGTIRDRVARTRPADGVVGAGTSRAGGVAPIGGGSVAPVGRGSVAPIGGGGVAPIGGTDRVQRDGVTRDSGSGRINRSGERREVDPPAPTTPVWRNRVERPREGTTPERQERSDTWRGRVSRGGERDTTAPPPARVEPRSSDRTRGSDVPRRVIDRIGGARIDPAPRDRGSSSSRGRDSAPPRSVDRPSGSSGSSRDGDSSARSSPPPRQSAPASRGEGGRVKRDN